MFAATSNLTSLNRVDSLYVGKAGQDGRNKDCDGKSAHQELLNVGFKLKESAVTWSVIMYILII